MYIFNFHFVKKLSGYQTIINSISPEKQILNSCFKKLTSLVHETISEILSTKFKNERSSDFSVYVNILITINKCEKLK